MIKCKYKFQDKEKFNGKTYCTLFNELCGNISFVCDRNCQVFEDYKQLKHKEKDYNELENTSVEIIRDYRALLDLAKQLINKTLEQFHLTRFDWKEDQNEITTELQKFVDSKKECEELKEKNNYLERKVKAEIHFGNSYKKDFADIADKYIKLKQVLQEIKEIVRFVSNGENNGLNKILKIISEVEE